MCAFLFGFCFSTCYLHFSPDFTRSFFSDVFRVQSLIALFFLLSKWIIPSVNQLHVLSGFTQIMSNHTVCLLVCWSIHSLVFNPLDNNKTNKKMQNPPDYLTTNVMKIWEWIQGRHVLSESWNIWRFKKDFREVWQACGGAHKTVTYPKNG